MTLVVTAFWDDPKTGVRKEFTDWTEGHHMAGVESARHDLWGASAVRRRGAVLLPRLASGDLWVEPMDLGAFVEEVDRLLADVNALADEVGRRGDVLEHYLRNFLRAAEYARRRHGGICIT